jgi:dienelactone hydrolase
MPITSEGSSHWFFEQDRAEAFNPAASKLAWERTIDFLSHTMKLTKRSNSRR